jgi:hypothetical protein
MSQDGGLRTIIAEKTEIITGNSSIFEFGEELK